jgi:membrane protein implicated in regulation of membrane protease activity
VGVEEDGEKFSSFHDRAISFMANYAFVLGLLFVTFAVGLLLHFEPHSLYLKVFLVAGGEVGFAFIIAAFFSKTVEKQARREYNQYVTNREKVLSKNIFDYLYSVKIDDKVFKFIEENIYQNPFYRTNLDVEYEFCEEDGDWFVMRQTLSYSVRNISSKEQVFFVNYDIEKPLGSNLPNFEKLGVYKLKIGKMELSPQQIEDADLAGEDSDLFKKYRHKCTLRPSEKIDVVIGAHLPKRHRDAEQWRSSLTSDGMKARIRYDAKRYDVKFMCVHPNAAEIEPQYEPHQIHVTLSEPLLPKHGLYFWWGPAKNADEEIRA